MEIKTVNATMRDQLSAQVLFDGLFSLREVFWPTHQEFERIRVLDAFARNGQLTLRAYRDKPNVVFDAWELAEEHRHALRLSGAKSVQIGCSYELLYTERLVKPSLQYDLLVIDSPQGLHSDSACRTHAEHFDFLLQSVSLLGDGGVIVLYVNKKPYNALLEGQHGYDTYSEFDYDRWMQEREGYYGSRVITEEQALKAYKLHLESMGYQISQVLSVPCLSDVPGVSPYAFRLALRVERFAK